MTIVYLIRHAENDFVGKKLAGWLPGVNLNARGLEQAAALAAAMAEIRLKAIYSSPLERAQQTAAPLAAAKKLAMETRADLGELRVGTWEGKTLKALRRRKLWPLVQFAPSRVRFPEGESFAEAQTRIIGDIEQLRARHSSPQAAIACVSHADMIKLAIAYYLGLPLDLFQRLEISPASISVLRIEDRFARLITLNDLQAHHIRGGG